MLPPSEQVFLTNNSFEIKGYHIDKSKSASSKAIPQEILDLFFNRLESTSIC